MADRTETQASAADKAAEAPRREVERSARSEAPAGGADREVRGSAAQGQTTEQRFGVSDLIARGSDFLGQPSYVVAGALHGVEEDELTLDDARGRVQAWLEQPVTPEEE